MSTRELAEQIAAPTIGKVAPMIYREIVDAIDEALKARDERAAQIAEQDSIISWVGGSTGDAKGTAKRIAAAIRSDTP